MQVTQHNLIAKRFLKTNPISFFSEVTCLLIAVLYIIDVTDVFLICCHDTPPHPTEKLALESVNNLTVNHLRAGETADLKRQSMRSCLKWLSKKIAL